MAERAANIGGRAPVLTPAPAPGLTPTARPGAMPALLLATVLAVTLAGCASGPRGGRDGPGSKGPADVAGVPDAQPRVESIRSSGGTSKPYTVLGRSYTPITDDRRFSERGLASWYGSKFHAGATASGETYDMYAMTAAHKTLPLPSYVRVRNPANGREVIVRVNDRGPFVDGRVIDLSYAAASRLDLLRGVAPVEIERITNEDIRTGAWRREGGTAYAAAPAAPVVAAAPVALAGGASAAAPRTSPSTSASTAPVAASAAAAMVAAGSMAASAPSAAPASTAADDVFAAAAAAPARAVEVPSQWAQPVVDTAPGSAAAASTLASAPTSGSAAAPASASALTAPASAPTAAAASATDDPPAPVRYIESRDLGYLGTPETHPDDLPRSATRPTSTPSASASAAGTASGAARASAGRAAPAPGDSAAPTGATRGYWVQLGAFRDAAGAQDLLARTARGVPEFAGQLRVFGEGGTNRLQAGPFATRGEAGDALARLREGTGGAPIIVERN